MCTEPTGKFVPTGDALTDALRRVAIARGEASPSGWSTVSRDEGKPPRPAVQEQPRVRVKAAR